MKLLSMTLHGFKSFAKPTRLYFADKVTAIVGPNGGGKSNIVDAIRWVFGEQSMKQLRADEKYDVIFAGSSTMPAASSAYVEIVFENENDRIVVSRMLTNDGKNLYMLNGETVRLKDIHEKFIGTGIGKEFYSIAGQGQIERIVNASPEELRLLLEEAAETAFYREKKKESMARLEVVNSNLTRVQDLLYELDRQRKSLYLKAKRAERYQEYSARLEQVKKLYYGNVLKKEMKRLSHLQNQHAETSEKIKDLQKQLLNIETNWSTLKQEFANVDKEIEGFTNLLEDYKKRQTTLMELREMYSRRLNERETKFVETTTRLDSAKEQIATIDKRSDELNLIFKALIDEIGSKESELTKVEQSRNEIISRYSEKEKQLLALKEKRDLANKEKLSLEGELSRIEEGLDDLSKRTAMIDSQLDLKQKRLSGLQEELSALLEKLKTSGDREASLAKELQSVRERLSELSNEKRSTFEQLDNIKRSLRNLDEEEAKIRYRIQTYEGYTRSVRAIFAKKAEGEFDGVFDVVGNLVSFPAEYAKAIEVLLGGAVQHVVVDNANTAKKVIEWLNSEKVGRVTFLPLDLIESHFSGMREIERHPGFVGYAAQIVRVNQQFMALPGYLFGNDIIVKTLDDAVDIKKRYKVRCRMATLNGEIIGQHGSITGGEVEVERTDSLVKRKLRLNEIATQRLELSSIERLHQQKLNQIDQEVQTLTNQERLVERELTDVIAEGSSTKRMIEELSKTVEELSKEINSLEQLKRGYLLKSEGMQMRRESILSELEELSLKVTSYESELKDFDEQLSSEKQVIEEISTQYSQLKAEVTSLLERKLHYESELARLRDQKQRLEEESLQLASQSEEIEKEIDRLRNTMLENQRELETVKKETENLFETMRMQRSDKDQKLAQLDELEKKMQQMKEEREKSREYLHHLELSIQEVQNKIQQLIGEVDEQTALEAEELEAERLEALKNELEDLQNKIKYLGPVDLLAIDEYNQVESKYNDLAIQKKDLEDAKEKINDLIKRTDEEARNRLLDVYEQVNTKFNYFISLLFAGGEGEIRIEPGKDILEAGVEISVKKPGKRIQKLQLLSGGEKALVGIALLFALLEVKPSPFYVLDEIDAPLDEFNAERFKRLLEDGSTKAQFVVITHNKVVMESADLLHGVTMIDGVSNVVPVEIENVAVKE
ncbi:MAG TPA: chromosome segregation protein SMC [Pseudothermotoga sp.]|nr:chromosome segregation protein SMC [Pseudothermotoga sp.]HOK83300.1 chromosome segregation protein SMC [Pseudothermotoga sp.]HPP70125.1 chromosome segregation protein SMC [Pseudothermotoga sp.]